MMLLQSAIYKAIADVYRPIAPAPSSIACACVIAASSLERREINGYIVVEARAVSRLLQTGESR